MTARPKRPKAPGRDRKSRLVSVRMSLDDYVKLGRAARAAEIPIARLSRVLICFGLTELARGNEELERAVKIARDA